MDFAPYSNNNVVAMMRRMNYLSGMNLGMTVKKPIVQVPMIPTATPPLGLGYKPTDDDLLEMEVRRMACAKAKAKGTSLFFRAFKALYSYIEWKVCQNQRQPTTRTMMPGFELLLDYNNKIPKLEKEDTIGFLLIGLITWTLMP